MFVAAQQILNTLFPEYALLITHIGELIHAQQPHS
jgi:hypothetical protein